MMAEEPQNQIPSAPTGKLSFKERISEWYQNFTNSIIFLLSVCLTFVLFVEYGHKIKDFDWPFYSDRILLVLLVFSILFGVLDSLKTIIVLILVLVSVYWLFIIIVGVVKEWNSVQSVNEPQKPSFTQNIQMLFPDNEETRQALDSARKDIKLLKLELTQLKLEMDSVKMLNH